MLHSIAQTLLARSVLKFLQVSVLIAEAVIIGRLLHSEDLTWVFYLIAGTGSLALVFMWWPYGALLALIGASAMPRYYVEMFGWKVRPEHFAVGLIVVASLARMLRQRQLLQFAALDYLVIAYVAVNYASSVLISPQLGATLRWALLNNLAVMPYFLLRLFVRERQTLHRAFKILLGAGIIEAIYGILCFGSHVVFGTTVGEEPGQYLDYIPGTYGSQYEANLFGSYAGCTAIMFLALYFFERHHPRRYLLGFAVVSLAMVVSLARAALFGFGIAVLFLVYYAHGKKQLRLTRLIPLLASSAVLLLILSPLVGDFLAARVSTLSLTNPESDETLADRLIAYAVSLEDVRQHPFLGNGTASLQLLTDQRENPQLGDRPWVGNTPLRVLHDTGLIGLILFLVFVVWLVVRVRDGIRAGRDESRMLIALLSGGIVYGVTFQATDATMLSFTWVHLGLMSSAALLAETARARAQVSPRPAA